MNFIKQIESALKAINEARFQDLINHLLHMQGNTFIGAPGSAIAKEKTSKGAPDSFFEQDGKYIFVECTTKDKLDGARSFNEKLEKDIEHCFDGSKTNIPIEKIRKIILACTSKLTAEECDKINNKVKQFNPETAIEILNIQNLPFLIYDFPGLAEQYLGVRIIKGEIYNLPDFYAKTTKGLQPSLTNLFLGREEELKESIEHLQNTDVLILQGPAGAGKSKLATKILEEFQENFIPIVIQSSAVPLWDDFVHLFQNNKDYIILFDDANKSVHNLIYLLNFIQKPKANKLKVIITVRDYVKHLVSQQLKDFSYKELTIDTLKDDEIEKIILNVLPNLEYYYDIRRKIVELSKGNARVALMATYSVTPGSEINYLDSPVLLYEKYFERVAEEIESFGKPIIFKALAIVSFFGTLDRNSPSLQDILKADFDVDWDELWTAILQLHENEILDVYSNEIVKVSDQVLASYAFYKCFLDSNSKSISYKDWIAAFIGKYPNRIKNTLIDANNTFGYHHVKDLVAAQLESIISNEESAEKLYAFHSLFWFYTGYDTLLYLKKWIDHLPAETTPAEVRFIYEHNNHSKASKYFELLVNFWNHSNELLRPSIDLALELTAKQPSRVPEFLKFINDYFSYKIEDLNDGYQRQNILFDALENENRTPIHRQIAVGTFLNIGEVLLGGHFTELRSKGIGIKIVNFNLSYSSRLNSLRSRIYGVLLENFDQHAEQSEKILNKIIFPGGNIQKQFLIDELPFFTRLISEKLSASQYSHCIFVKQLTKKITALDLPVPDEWSIFINSEAMRLSKLLKTDYLEGRNGKSWQEREETKREKIHKFIKNKPWREIENLLYSIDSLFAQQKDRDIYLIEGGISEVFVGIAINSKIQIKKALSTVFDNTFSFSIQPRVIYYIVANNILNAEELVELIAKSNCHYKTTCITALLEAVPENQINSGTVELLLDTFKSGDPIYIHRLTDYLKFESQFQLFKNSSDCENLKDHNIITCLTEIILKKESGRAHALGFHFCRECHTYFSDHIYLLKSAYIALKKNDRHFDYDGKELEAVLKLDSFFFIEYLEQKAADTDFLSFRFDNYKLECIWLLPNYSEIIDQCLDIIINKTPVYSNWKHPSAVLFTFASQNEELLEKASNYISDYINANFKDSQKTMMILSIALYCFNSKFVAFLKQFLLLNEDIKLFKSIWLTKSGVTTGSRVPYIQKEIEFIGDILSMVKGLPDILKYAEHVKYLEKHIQWLKKDIQNEQRRDFEEYYD